MKATDWPVQEAPLPEGEAKAKAVRGLFDTIAPRYDLVNRIMTFGMDRGWRRQTVGALALNASEVVIDLACGTGDLCRDLAAAGYQAVGVDFSFGMLRHARAPSPLMQGDALALPLADGSAAGVVSGFALRNFVDLDRVFAELARVVRPGGRIALLDVGQPSPAILRIGHGFYFGHVVPRIGAVFSDADAYRYLPRSVAYLPSPEALRGQLEAAGFVDVKRRQLSRGITQLYTATRKESR